MNEKIYNLTWGNDKDENMYIKSNCTPTFMKDAIEEKNARKCNSEYDSFADSEVLEKILEENGFTYEDVTPQAEYTFAF